MANNRRDYFLDTVLYGILSGISGVTLSKVFVEPDNVQDRVVPRISYHLLDDRKTWSGEARNLQTQSTQQFALLAYAWTSEDTQEVGLLASKVNAVTDLVEKAFENAAQQIPYSDTNGMVITEWVRLDDVMPTVDDLRQTAVIEIVGTITYSKYPQ